MLCFHSIYDQCLIQNLTKYSICSEIANNISIFTHQKLFFLLHLTQLDALLLLKLP